MVLWLILATPCSDEADEDQSDSLLHCGRSEHNIFLGDLGVSALPQHRDLKSHLGNNTTDQSKCRSNGELEKAHAE